MLCWHHVVGKRTELAATLSAGELWERTRARKDVDAKEARRWQALWLFGQGSSARQVSAATGSNAIMPEMG